MNETVKKTTVRKSVLVDVRIVCNYEPDAWKIGLYAKNGVSWEEARARLKQERADEFNAFIKDHRSQDNISLSVEKVREDQCSECGHTWEPDTVDGDVSCAWCGAVLETDALQSKEARP